SRGRTESAKTATLRWRPRPIGGLGPHHPHSMLPTSGVDGRSGTIPITNPNPRTPMPNNPKSSFALITLILPGPDRKRTPAPYHYRMTYRNPEPGEPGCVITWEVLGGREEYQISLERTDGGELIWHCTCPDAVYHGSYPHPPPCKPVHGLRGVVAPPRSAPRKPSPAPYR